MVWPSGTDTSARASRLLSYFFPRCGSASRTWKRLAAELISISSPATCAPLASKPATVSRRGRGREPRSSSTLYGGRRLVSTGLPSRAKVTLSMLLPVERVSKRCMPVCSSPNGRTSLIMVSPVERAARASYTVCRMRALAESGSLGGGPAATRSEEGTVTVRSSRKALPELMSSTLTISV